MQNKNILEDIFQVSCRIILTICFGGVYIPRKMHHTKCLDTGFSVK
jgi:hypothetical protein